MDSLLSNNSEKTTLAKASTDSSENVVLPEEEENLLTGMLIYFFCVWTCLLGLFQGLTLSVREILIFLPWLARDCTGAAVINFVKFYCNKG